MADGPVDYLDAIFAALRRFGDELGSARAWLDRAEGTGNQRWRLAFLLEARRSRDAAAKHLDALERRLEVFGRSAPPPFDRLAETVPGLRHELATTAAGIAAREGDAARAAVPIGHG